MCKIQNFLQVRVHTKKFGGDKSKHWQLHYIFLCFHFFSVTVQHHTASGLIIWKVKHIQWLCCPKASADIARHSVYPMHYRYFCWTGFSSFSILLYFSLAAHLCLLSANSSSLWGFSLVLPCDGNILLPESHTGFFLSLSICPTCPPTDNFPTPSPSNSSFAFLPPEIYQYDNWAKICMCACC